MLEIFEYQFMIRAFIAGFFISALLGFLGSFVVVRKMSFIGEGIAHASLAGVAISLFMGWAPISTAILFAILVAIGIYFLEEKVNISSDVAIGVMFTTGMAFGVIILNFYEGYQPELLSYLFGNILTISSYDLWVIALSSLTIISLLSFFYRKMLFITFDPDGAFLSGIDVWKYNLFFYVVIAVAVVLSIKLIGIVLVSALLVIPSALSMIFAKSFRQLCVLAIILSALIVFMGLVISYYLDLPSGATIVLTGSFLFLLGYLFK